MAPLPVIPDTFRLTVVGGPLVTANVMHFHSTTLNAATVASTFMSHMQADMINPFCSSQSWNVISVTPLDGSASTYTINTGGTGKWKGTFTGECSPQVAAVVKFNTVFRGRSNTGRTFIGPVSETANASGFLNTGIATAMATAWTTFQTQMVTAGCEQVVASYKKSTALTVLSYSVRNACGTVRLRQSRLA